MAALPPARARRAALGRAALGGARCGRDPYRHRSGTRVRHRLPRDDQALPRAHRNSAARVAARRRLRLGRARDRRGEARLLAGDRGRRRGFSRRGNPRQRGRKRRRARGLARRRHVRGAAGHRRRGRQHLARGGRGRRAATRGRRSDHVRLPRVRSPRAAGPARPRPPHGGRLGGGGVGARLTFRAVATFSVHFLGCKVSHVDAHAVRERLLADGHTERAGDHDGADVAVVNTCCVTNEAVAKSRKAVARAARMHGRVYVTGCGANLAGDAFAGLPPNVTVVARRSEETPAAVAGDVGAIACVQAEARLDRVRAFVKVQDGCSFSCAFCVIPLVRGASRSRSAGAVLREVRRRVEQGHREVVLTGINLGCYRDREAGYSLARLVHEAGATPGLARLRLSSIEVNHLSGELAAALRETPTVSRHLHVPLQSGDDGVLRDMARRYSTATYLRRLEPFADFNLTTDAIVGFPTETEAAFERTLAVIDAAGITKVHVFPYSPRPGTVTAAADPVAPDVKKERSARLRAASDAACLRRWREKIGAEDVVLVDRPGRGYGDDYSPWFVDAPVGELVRVRAAGVTKERI